MSEKTFIAIDGDALYSKSQVYIRRALDRKNNGDLDEYQLWSSLALELLGKAALARQHPSLVVDPSDSASLLVAAGVNKTTDVKTISAKKLFERLSDLVQRFDQTGRKFCEAITERRNAELHSADLPFKTMNLEAWEPNYWHVCDVILSHMNSSLEKWLDARNATAPRQLLQEAREALKAAVTIRMAYAREKFQKLTRKEREYLKEEAVTIYSDRHENNFEGEYDYIWGDSCPACDGLALMAGQQISETVSENISEGHEEYYISEIVECLFVGEEFRCIVCGLILVGSQEIEMADLDISHFELIEHEKEYQPKYDDD